MNYYPFHIGDYASATRHLSWDEDAAYRRLLDVYYTLERAIPEEKTYRLVVATSKTQRQAVDTVLADFFIKTPDGWFHERCEEEIDAMRVKQAAQEAKDNHESERMKRYRERRSSMFEVLRSVDIVPPWDVPMKELQRLVDGARNAPATTPATHLQREQVVLHGTPATAISTNPNPNPNPNTITKEKMKSAVAPHLAEIPPTLLADFLKVRTAKKAGALTETALKGIQREADKAGIPLVAAITACCEYGWQGFNAEWYADRTTAKSPKTALHAESFAERDARAKRQEWEVMTGRKWPQSTVPASGIIDEIIEIELKKVAA